MKRKCRYGKNSWQLAVGSWQLMLIACIIFSVSFIFSCKQNSEKQKSEITNPLPDRQAVKSEIYYCPMHPEVQQDHPGKCPVPECYGMDLVLKMSDTLLENTLKPVNASVLASLKTVKPVFQKMNLDVEADGYIDYDSRTENNISSLYSGRIEKLYVKYQYQSVRKGEKIFEIYSPELVTAQENLVYLLKNDSEETSLINAAKQKLKLLGFSDNLLYEIIKTNNVFQSVPVYSAHEGRARSAMKSPSGEKNTMASERMNSSRMTEIFSVKEGMYVMMGESIFNIVSSNRLVIVLQIRAEDISKLKTGTEVEIKTDDSNGITLNGKIDFIEPTFKEGFKTMTAKVYIDNSKHIHKVGSLVKTKIKGQEMDALWIPLSALVDLGNEKIVWLKTDGNFIATKVETGTISDNMIEISDGLTEEDEIALEAHYLIDSEGFIKIIEDEN